VQALIELIAGFIALLAAVALAQFGMDMAQTAKPDREVRRLQDCGNPKPDTASVTVASRRC
jgi:hypothetical protein